MSTVIPRVLVCGGRNYDNKDHVFRTLDQLVSARGWNGPADEFGNCLPNIRLIHGACNCFRSQPYYGHGVDFWADQWAIANWIPVMPYPANWKAHGRAAGPIRNRQMIIEGKPDVVVAFPGGKGTANMIDLARINFVPVHIAKDETAP